MTETPKYAVLKKHNALELRQYAGYIQAEVTVVAPDYRTAVERGFRVLAGFIFGNNTTRQSIAMTTPVQVAPSEKIAMTTPVTVSGDGRFTVAFIMPAEYTLETLPVPSDSAIRFTPVPAHRLAAIRFSGYFQNDIIRKNTERLSHWLTEQGWEADGDYTVAGYNPPWVPGFLARNEVMVRLKAPPAAPA